MNLEFFYRTRFYFLVSFIVVLMVIAPLYYVFHLPIPLRWYEDSVLGGCMCGGAVMRYEDGKFHFFNTAHGEYKCYMECEIVNGSLVINGDLRPNDYGINPELIEVRWDGLYHPGLGLEDDLLARRSWFYMGHSFDELKDMEKPKKFIVIGGDGITH